MDDKGIVHCKDCKYMEWDSKEDMAIYCKYFSYGWVFPESFCSFGVEKFETLKVVRCKDCKYYQEKCTKRDGTIIYFCSNKRGLPSSLKEYDYCCYGERRE